MSSLTRTAREVWDAYNRHAGGLMAAAMAFYALLAVVPILSAGVAALGWVIGDSREALERLDGVIRQSFPASGSLLHETLTEIKRESGLAGALGLVVLLVSASAIFTNMELAFNAIWQVPKPRPWWRGRLVGLGTTVLALVLLLSSLAITSVLAWARSVRVPGLGLETARVPLLWQAAGHLVPVALSIALFALIYRIVPNRPVRWRDALSGGALAGIAWEAAKHLFAWYVTQFANYSRVYGSLGVIVSLMFWAYYSMVILFLGGEIAARCGRRAECDDEAARPPIP